MRRVSPAAVATAYFVIMAGTFAGLVPWLIAGRRLHQPLPHWAIAQAVGAVLICAGLVPVVDAFSRFARAGGTPLPLVPTDALVVTGFHRHVRNPIYVGSLVVLVGEALLYGSRSLLAYAAGGLGDCGRLRAGL